MAMYVDVETSPEALQDDVELMEAVNELVGTLTEVAQAELASEVNEFVSYLRNQTAQFCPAILVEYQREPQRLREDLERLALFAALVVWAIWFLAPSTTLFVFASSSSSLFSWPWSWYSGSNNSNDNTCGRNADEEERVEDGVEMDQSLGWKRSNSGTNTTITNTNNSNAIGEDTTTTSSDEERFERLWAESIMHSGYSKLALPPSCRRRRILRPSVLLHPRSTSNATTTNNANTSSSKNNTSTHASGPPNSGSMMSPTNLPNQKRLDAISTDPTPIAPPTSSSSRSSITAKPSFHHTESNACDADSSPSNNTNNSNTTGTNGSGNTINNNHDDDNPVARLQYYCRQLWLFLRSILSFDYITACTTLWSWFVGLRRIRQNHPYTSEKPTTKTQQSVSEDNRTDKDGATATTDTAISGISSLTTEDDSVGLQPDPTVHESATIEVEPLRRTDCATTVAESQGGKRDNENELLLDPPVSDFSKSDNLKKPHPLLSSTVDDSSYIPETTRCPPLHLLENDAATVDTIPESFSPFVATKPLLVIGRHQSDGSVYFDPPPANDDASCGDTGSSLNSGTSQWQHHSTHSARLEEIGNDHHNTIAEPPPSRTSNNRTALSTSLSTSLTPKRLLSANNQDSSTRHYFDTAQSPGSIRKMPADPPAPDKNGYILGDVFLQDSSRYTPLLVFVNSRSGPQQGPLLLAQLRRLLNPIQVWDLSEGDPKPILESFMVLSRLRLLVCGGDGTVSWIINTLEEMKVDRRHYPPIAILPLGTGNDLARIHGWGGGYNYESLITILEQISESYSSLLDRWEVVIHETKGKKTKEVKGFFNYLGVGADAQAALQVHYLRESRPDWFFSRVINKAMYGIFGAEDIIKATTVNVRKEILLIADGVEVPLPLDSQGIILLNIDAYAGGVPLWSHGVHANGFSTVPTPRRTRSMSEFDQTSSRLSRMDRIDSVDDLQNFMSTEERFAHVTACDMPSSCQDGYLDVVSIRGAFHLGQIKVGLGNAQRLCQCREASIVIRNRVAVQVDGEPWRQNACTLTIKRKRDPAVMLHRSADDGGVETEMSKLLDWAETRKMIDSQVHSILMKEFSRRIESKKRQRRVRQQENIVSTLKKAISSGAMANSLTGSGQTVWQF